MRKDFIRTKWRAALASVMLSACLGGFTSCSQYDLDENDPEGWGASIYNYLEEQGNYTNTLNLIDDLGLKETLAKTGSKTMFVADDDAYARFYAKNEWGVKKYSDLTLSQKKMLLLGSMINNVYQVHDLASIKGPIEGQSIRRLSSMTVYDTVAVLQPNQLPNMGEGEDMHNKTWLKFKGRDNVVIMKDMTITPLTYFVEAALSNNKITNEDYYFLFNRKETREGSDASVNGVKMVQQNIKCSNGFIHKMGEVMVPLKNMAEIVATNPETSIFSKFLNRFAAPFYIGKDETTFYNEMYGKSVDSVFQMRYFSDKSQGGTLTTDDDKIVHHDLLRYDPGWNTYYANPIPNATVAAEKDMALMLVPTDSALNDYFYYGEGQVLKDQYEKWENVPNDVIVELINNNMLYSFIAGVPSKFGTILNDANDPMKIEESHVKEVRLGCNGAVYVTKTVFPPTSFVSVLYPAIINESMKIIRWAVENNNYKVYLNSLNVPSGYSFFIPTNDAMLSYVDPVSYAGSQAVLYKFHYDASQSKPVWASRFYYNLETGEVGDSIDEIRNNDDVMKQKLKEVLDNHIVIGDVEDGNTYYRTKGGQEIMVQNAALGEHGMVVSGSLDINENRPGISVSHVYNQKEKGNGKSYILDRPILTTNKTVYDVLSEHPEMSKFLELLESSSILGDNTNYKRFAGLGMKVFNTYHYTVYVPTNESIQALINSGELPTWDDVQKAHDDGDKDKEEELTNRIENFLKLHIQDYSLFIGAKPESEEGYETAYINEKDKFERVYTTLTKDGITIKNSLDTKASGYMEAHVLKKDGLYNLMAREYLINSADYDVNDKGLCLYTSSTAVIHMIDKPLKVAK